VDHEQGAREGQRIEMAVSRWSARMGVTSAPWMPATSASTGPGRAPWTTVIGMNVPPSAPAATSIRPVADVPGAAVTSPIEKAVCADAARAVASRSINAVSTVMLRP